MKKIIAWLLVLALTAAISIGATLAYLTDTDEDVNVMTLGKVKIDQLEYERIDDETANEKAEVQEFHDNKPLYPAVTGNGFDYTPGATKVDWTQIGKNGYTSDIWDPSNINNELDKMVFIKNKGDYDAYVRSIFAFEAGKYTTLDEFQKMVHLNLNETDYTWEWVETPVTIGESTYFVATATYSKILAPGALTEISLSQIALDKTATNEDVEAFGETYKILVKSQGIQADGFTDAATALNEGFGDVEVNIPWQDDSVIRGIDVRTALHNLNGDINQPITANVTHVVFGLNSEYPEIVANYDGTLVDVEQDVPVHTYYVNDGNRFTVYFLANSAVYAPKDCNKLFALMSKLTEVDVHNLDVSRVETMRNMFRECGALVSLDLADWDTSNVTDMGYMFNKCTNLSSLSVDNWDTSKVTNFATMFQKCSKLTSINVANWDTGAVTDMKFMFNGCTNLEGLTTDNWDTSNVTNFTTMFQGCKKLAKLNVANWDTGSATDLSYMFNDCFVLPELAVGNWDTSNVTTLRTIFANCQSITSLDVSKWDTSNVTTLQNAFMKCYALAEIKGINGWDTAKVTNLEQTFWGCRSLDDLDVSNWKTSNVTTMKFTFNGCSGLVELDLSGWDTSKVTTFSSMFSSFDDNTGDMQLKAIHAENWDTSSCTAFSYMFYGCGSLEELDLSKWDASSVTTTYHMFADCFNLKSVNFTGWNTPKLTNMDGMFNDCRSLVSVDLSDLDTQNVTDMSQLFEACYSLKEVKGLENWDTSKVWDFDQMFQNCSSIEVIDLSPLDTSAATSTSTMFQNCSSLKTIYVGDGWNMSKVTSSGSMFNNCPKLVGANGTTTKGNPTDVTYARVDTPEAPGYLTYKSAT